MRSPTRSDTEFSVHHQRDSEVTMPAGDSPLVISHLSKRYKGGVQANSDISLTANHGEILGILGPNGAGKTTLVRQITAEISPSSGEIYVGGLNIVTDTMAVKNILGIMPQDSTLFAYLTVHQHLRIFAKLRGIPPGKAASRADELMEELSLTEYRDVEISKLSGGLIRRVMVGIAALSNPPVLVLDEPTTGLDPQSRRNLWALLRRYQQRGSFVLLTTHSMEEAEALCTRVGIIKGGRLLAFDTVDNLRAQHGFQFKVTYYPYGPENPGTTIYGADDQALISQVSELGHQQFTVGRPTLEDIYLAMTGGLEGFDDQPA